MKRPTSKSKSKVKKSEIKRITVAGSEIVPERVLKPLAPKEVVGREIKPERILKPLAPKDKKVRRSR